MKKSKLKNKIFALVVVFALLSSLFVFPSFATNILDDYSRLGYIGVNSDDWDSPIRAYVFVNVPVVSNYNSNYFADFILSLIGFNTSQLKSNDYSTFLSHINNGNFISDGIVKSAYTYFVDLFNQGYASLVASLSNSSYRDGVLDGSRNVIFNFNPSFRDYILKQVQKCIELLPTGYNDNNVITTFAYTPLEDTDFSKYISTDVEFNSSNVDRLFNFALSLNYRLVYPYSQGFNFDVGIDFIKNPDTWSFIPSWLSPTLLSFLGALITITLVAVSSALLRKLLMGGG